MYSKFDFFNFPTSLVAPKETKLQKYLRLKNEHIMKKCFDFKKENRDVESNKESLKQREQDETNHEKSPDHSSSAENNALVSAETEDEELLRPADDTCSQPITIIKIKPASVAGRVQLKPLAAASNRQLVNANSKHKFNAEKTYKCKTAKRSTGTLHWKSPFKSFITNGLRTRTQSSEFGYDLSRDEMKFSGHFSSPMKPAPESERQLLKQGPRRDYLVQRYEHSPVVKYNYPEATSWRIGWLQQKP